MKLFGILMVDLLLRIVKFNIDILLVLLSVNGC